MRLTGLVICSLKAVLYFSVRADTEGLNKDVLGREIYETEAYTPPMTTDYRQLSLDENIHPSAPAGVVTVNFA